MGRHHGIATTTTRAESVNQMAARMNKFVAEARRRGVLIVHAPSSGMKHYADHPARRRAQDAPQAADLPEGIAGWCRDKNMFHVMEFIS